MPTALISVSDKTGLIEFARGLRQRHFELVSTGGTAKALQDAGLPVVGISDVTGFPEMMDGRVKTLHPRVHGGILARRDRADHVAAAAEHGIGMIDLVVVNLYPFVKAAANPATSFEALVEEIDIGGPSLVRGAAKNFRDVLVVVSPADYGQVLEQLDRSGGPTLAYRFELARQAFAHTASYDAAIASTLADVTVDATSFTRANRRRPAVDAADRRCTRSATLRYGENPHQQAALYRGFGPFPSGVLLQGKELSYTNLLDLDAAARIVLDFAEPAAAVIKHTNPCGVATGADIASAYARAREADALAAFGGIVALNRSLDAARGAGDRVDVHRSGVRAVARRRRTRDPGEQAEHARRPYHERLMTDGEARASYRPAGRCRAPVRSWAACWCRRATTCARPTNRGRAPDFASSPSGSRLPTSGWRSVFAWRVCAHVKSNTGHLHHERSHARHRCGSDESSRRRQPSRR
jgi:phosphoribosylaminoimidazolecarboxamide formyltransferase/IMP cyclohydrolase